MTPKQTEDQKTSDGSIKQKAVSGVYWTFIDTFGRRGIGFIIGLFLARLLDPAEYGLLGMIAVFTTVAWMFIDSGFGQAMIRKPDLTEADKLTAFWYSFGMGVTLYLLLFFCAPLISDFYNEPRLTAIVRVVSIPIVLSPFSTIPNITFTRAINFRVLTKISLFTNITSGILGIWMAFNGYGVWALIAQQLLGTVISLFIKNYICRWHIKFVFKKKSFQYLWGFGNKMLASSLINTIYGNLYPIMIGKVYSPATLGQYSRANDYCGLFSSTLTDVIQKVSFPTLSKIQDDLERLRNGYRKIIKTSMLASCTGCLALAAMAHPLIITLIGEKWEPCTEYMQIICFSSMLYPVHAINLNILTVMGRSDLFLKLEIIKKIIGVLPLFIGYFWGIKIMLVTSIFTGFIAFGINAHYSKDLIKYSWAQQILDIMPYILSATAIGFITWTISLLPIHYVLQLCIQIPFFVVLTIGYYELKKNEAYLELKSIAIGFWHKLPITKSI